MEIAAGRLATRAQLRAAGVHSLLGALQEGAMGGEAQDGQGPTQPSAEEESVNGAEGIGTRAYPSSTRR